jgi:hypothetical protein
MKTGAAADGAAAADDGASSCSQLLLLTPPTPPPRPSPPDCRRYWALWKPETKEEEEDAAASRRGGVDNNDEDDGPAVDRQRGHLDRARNIDLWNGELELARYNLSVRTRVDVLLDTHLRTGEEENSEEAGRWRGQVQALMLELDLTTILPRAIRKDGAFWDDFLPETVKHDKSFAWLLLGLERRLPLPFQKMLWMDPNCPLREDRGILLASLQKGLDINIRIVWSKEMATDKELVTKCLEASPKCIRVDNGYNSGLPPSCLQDMEILRRLAYSEETRDFAAVWKLFRTHARLVTADARLMADIIVGLSDDGRYRGEWVLPIVGASFPAAAPTYWARLLDSVDFALHLAHRIMSEPDASRDLCPVKFRSLSRRVRGTSKVALAYVQLDGSVARHLPMELSLNREVWHELWKVATDNCPEAIYSPCLMTKPCSELVSKDLVLRLLKSIGSNTTLHLSDFRQLFLDCSPEIKADREINKWLVLSTAVLPRAGLYCPLAAELANDRDFWIELADAHHCPLSVWASVPTRLQSDAALALAWARHARPERRVNWIEDAIATFPHLGLLSDRQVLLNWVPELYQVDPRAKALLNRIPPDCLNKTLWSELLSKGDPRDYLSCMPECVRHDPEIVDAQLRSCITHDRLFLQCYNKLPLSTQHQLAQRLTEAIQGCPRLSFFCDWDTELEPELLRIPEVARSTLRFLCGHRQNLIVEPRPRISSVSGRVSPFQRRHILVLLLRRSAS